MTDIPTQTQPQNSQKILLIEDEHQIADLYSRVLKMSGFDVLNAYDGLEGLYIAQQQPKLILLDIMLPKMDGIEVLKNLKSKSQTKDIPVVLLTNLGQAEIIQKAFALGAQGYFLKMHLELDDLTQNIQKFLSDPSYKMDPNKLVLD